MQQYCDIAQNIPNELTTLRITPIIMCNQVSIRPAALKPYVLISQTQILRTVAANV